MAKIYTRTGDGGETGLLGGPRVLKSHPRVETNGAIDELSAVLGVCRTQGLDEDLERLVRRIQWEIYWIAAEVACPTPETRCVQKITPEHVQALEQEIDQYDQLLPALEHFVLPGGTRAAALLHLARTLCRRAERRLVELRRVEPQVRQILVAYLNRLGDLLFVLARVANHRSGVGDDLWPNADPSDEKPPTVSLPG